LPPQIKKEETGRKKKKTEEEKRERSVEYLKSAGRLYRSTKEAKIGGGKKRTMTNWHGLEKKKDACKKKGQPQQRHQKGQ